MKVLKIAAVIVLLMTVVLSCAPQLPSLSPVGETTEAVTKPTLAKQPWETEWEKVVAEGKKEGKVVIYSNAGGDVRGLSALRRRTSMGLSWSGWWEVGRNWPQRCIRSAVLACTWWTCG
jgi:hypothetical protein